MTINALCYKCKAPTTRYQSENKRGVLCKKHRFEQSTKYYKENSKKIIENAKIWNKENKEKRNDRLKSKYANLKLSSINMYGGKCVCGENNIVFLTIDHINGGGRQHRRTFADKIANLHIWLKQNKYPPGYQVLCASCNYKKEMQSRKDKTNFEKNKTKRLAILDIYGKSCACCYESDLDKLVIDHIHGNGTKEKRKYGNVYNFLLKQQPDYEKYQILCQNCNQAKASLGQCPHLLIKG